MRLQARTRGGFNFGVVVWCAPRVTCASHHGGVGANVFWYARFLTWCIYTRSLTFTLCYFSSRVVCNLCVDHVELPQISGPGLAMRLPRRGQKKLPLILPRVPPGSFFYPAIPCFFFLGKRIMWLSMRIDGVADTTQETFFFFFFVLFWYSSLDIANTHMIAFSHTTP